MSSETADLQAIAPLTLSPIEVAGVACNVRRMKMREIMALLRIFVNGTGGALGQVEWNAEQDELQAELVGLFVVSSVNAIEETIAFLTVMLEPLDRDGERRLKRAMHNPEPEDLIGVIERIVEQEADDLAGLMGKVRALGTKMGATLTKAG